MTDRERQIRQQLESIQNNATQAPDGRLIADVAYVRFEDPWFGGPDDGRYLRVREAIDYDTWALGNDGTGVQVFEVPSAEAAVTKLETMGLLGANGVDEIKLQVELESKGHEPSLYFMPVLTKDQMSAVASVRDIIFKVSDEAQARLAAVMQLRHEPMESAPGKLGAATLAAVGVFPDMEQAKVFAGQEPQKDLLTGLARLTLHQAREFGAESSEHRPLHGIDSRNLTASERQSFRTAAFAQVWAGHATADTVRNNPFPWHRSSAVQLAGDTIESAAQSWLSGLVQQHRSPRTTDHQIE